MGGDESENERWMLARDRPGHVRQHPFPSFFPSLFSATPFFHIPLSRAHHTLFAPYPIFLAAGRVYSHVTRTFGRFSDHLLLLGIALIRSLSLVGSPLNNPPAILSSTRAARGLTLSSNWSVAFSSQLNCLQCLRFLFLIVHSRTEKGYS